MDSFQRFIEDANRQGLHKLDETRIENFVLDSHRSGAELDVDALRSRLEAASFDEDVAQQVIELVTFGRTLLARYDRGPDGNALNL
jgi:hypothetical protein